MSRFSVRLRLTLVFAAGMAAVLAAIGVVLYVRLGDSLLEQVDDRLQARVQTVSVLVRERGLALPPTELVSVDDEELVQVVSGEGEVLASAPGAADQPLVSPDEAARAAADGYVLQRDRVPQFEGGPARLVLEPVEHDGATSVVAAAGSLEDRAEALDGLLRQLLLLGPLALVASSLAGYLVAASALRPVEAMRRRAAEVSSERTGQRLPLPRANDEIRRLGETLNAMVGRLEAGLERERRLVADASHELRTPLSLLQMELDLALRRPRTNDELVSALRSAAVEVERLNRLAADLLTLAQADEGELSLRVEEVDAEELLDDVARRFSARATAEGRELHVIPGAHATLAGDRLRLEQALGDLVDNALRHGAGAIALEATTVGGNIELAVCDEGAGVPAQFAPLAFDRFARANGARTGGGAGLGLSLVAAIARAHGGTAFIRSGVGDRTRVGLTLPSQTPAKPKSRSATGQP